MGVQGGRLAEVSLKVVEEGTGEERGAIKTSTEEAEEGTTGLLLEGETRGTAAVPVVHPGSTNLAALDRDPDPRLLLGEDRLPLLQGDTTPDEGTLGRPLLKRPEGVGTGLFPDRPRLCRGGGDRSRGVVVGRLEGEGRVHPKGEGRIRLRGEELGMIRLREELRMIRLRKDAGMRHLKRGKGAQVLLGEGASFVLFLFLFVVFWTIRY